MMSSTPSPVAHWTFDVDASDTAGTNDGTLQNGAAIGGGTSGRINAGVQLDGNNDFVEVVDSHTDVDVTKNYTLTAWIKTDAIGNEQAIFSKVTGASSKQYLLEIRADGSLQFEYEVNNNNFNHNFGGTVTANTWHHVAVTVSDTLEIRAYLDGVRLDAATTVTAPAEVNTSNQHLNIGRRGGSYNYRYFDGVIDDARLYHAVLDAAAIGDLANPANLPQVTLTATDDRAVGRSGRNAGQFTVTRTGDLVGDLVVNYTISGNTVAGDYTQTLGGQRDDPRRPGLGSDRRDAGGRRDHRGHRGVDADPVGGQRIYLRVTDHRHADDRRRRDAGDARGRQLRAWRRLGVRGHRLRGRADGQARPRHPGRRPRVVPQVRRLWRSPTPPARGLRCSRPTWAPTRVR